MSEGGLWDYLGRMAMCSSWLRTYVQWEGESWAVDDSLFLMRMLSDFWVCWVGFSSFE